MAKLFDGTGPEPINVAVSLREGDLYYNDQSVSLNDVVISFISYAEIDLIIGSMNLEIYPEDQEFARIHSVLLSKKKESLKNSAGLALIGLLLILMSFFVFSYLSERLPDKYFGYIINDRVLIDLFPETCAMPDSLNKEIGTAIGEVNLKFHLISMPTANAFAYPHNQVFITEVMLLSLMNDHELFAVLGHEAGHLRLKHYKSQIGRMLFLDVVGSVLDKGQLGKMLEILLLNTYSRVHEKEADQYAVKALRKKGYPVMAGARVMELLKEKAPEFGPAFLSNHPSTEERLRYFLREAKGEKWKASRSREIILKIVKKCFKN